MLKDEDYESKTDTDMEQINTSSSKINDPNVLSSDTSDEKINKVYNTRNKIAFCIFKKLKM